MKVRECGPKIGGLRSPLNESAEQLEEFNRQAGRALLIRGLQPEDIFKHHDSQLRINAESAWLERSQAIVDFDRRIMARGIKREDFPDSWAASNHPDAMSRKEMDERGRLLQEHQEKTLADTHLPDHYKERQ